MDASCSVTYAAWRQALRKHHASGSTRDVLHFVRNFGKVSCGNRYKFEIEFYPEQLSQTYVIGICLTGCEAKDYTVALPYQAKGARSIDKTHVRLLNPLKHLRNPMWYYEYSVDDDCTFQFLVDCVVSTVYTGECFAAITTDGRKSFVDVLHQT